MPAVNRAIVVVDVEGFGDPSRTPHHRAVVREGMFRALEQSFAGADIPWSGCHREDRGDGVLVLAPPNVPKTLFADALPDRLAAALDEHNRVRPPEERIRLRMALHAGEVKHDSHGVTGAAINHTFRLIDARELKAGLAASSGPLAVIASSWFFQEVIRHSTPDVSDSFHPVQVNVKDTSTEAWVSLTGVMAPAAAPNTSRPRNVTSYVTAGAKTRSVFNEVSGAVAGAVVQARDIHGDIHIHQPDPQTQTSVVPRQLPAFPQFFVGRETELAQLDLMVDVDGLNPPKFASISGMGGAGKTWLALYWAHRLREQFPDGQLFVNLHGNSPEQSLPPEHALSSFLTALGVAAENIPPELDARSALFRSLVADRRMLIVLDSAASAEQVYPLLPGGGSCTVLVTSRSHLAGLVARYGARELVLDLLPQAEAMKLLRLQIGARRVDDEPETAAELVRMSGYLPLALAILAARIVRHPDRSLLQFVEELAEADARLDVFGVEDRTVRSVFALSYRLLSVPAARAFRLLSAHTGADFGVGVAAALADMSRVEIRILLRGLARSHMVQEVSRDRYRFHDLLREYARERMELEDSAVDRHATVRRALIWYLHNADAAAKVLAPQRTRDRLSPTEGFPSFTFETHTEALEWCETERANLVDSVSRAAQLGEHAIAWRLAVVLWDFFNLRKHWTDWVATSNVGLESARHIGDRFGEAAVLHTLGNAYYDLRRLKDAIDYYREALAIRQEVDDQWGESWTLNNLGTAYQELRQFAAAIEHYQQALAIRRMIDDRWGEGWTLNNLGEAHQRLQQFDTAIDYYQQALTNRRKTGDRYGEGFTLDNLGLAYCAQGRYEDAIRSCETALDIRRMIGDRWGEGWTLNNLGTAYREVGQFENAIDHYQQALGIRREVRDRWGEGWTLDNLGTALQATHRVDEARAHWQAARTILEDFENLKESDIPPRTPRQARIWCINEDPIHPGQPAHVAFAMVAPQGVLAAPGGGSPDQPLARPVELRVLLQAENATVRPVTQVVTLDVDRTSKPILFEVVPTGQADLELVFRVYLDRDSQLLQEIRAELPVSVAEHEVAGQ